MWNYLILAVVIMVVAGLAGWALAAIAWRLGRKQRGAPVRLLVEIARAALKYRGPADSQQRAADARSLDGSLAEFKKYEPNYHHTCKPRPSQGEAFSKMEEEIKMSDKLITIELTEREWDHVQLAVEESSVQLIKISTNRAIDGMPYNSVARAADRYENIAKKVADQLETIIDT